MSAEDDRVRANIARRKAAERAALDQVRPPSGLPILEGLTAGDLALLPVARLRELAADYARRLAGVPPGGPELARVTRVTALPSGGLEVAVAWRNLANFGGQGFTHRVLGPYQARCGASLEDAVPTDEPVTCPVCLL